MKKVSIVIPAYNEERFIGSLLDLIEKVPTQALGFEKEIIVVDDGSKDRTFEIASGYKSVTCIKQENQGKGRAVQNGIKKSAGDYILVQDADLEYFPMDYLPMLSLLNETPRMAVYGSRPLGQIRKNGRTAFFPGKHKKQSLAAWMANGILSVWTALLYLKWITDPLTAYKIYPSSIFHDFNIKTNGFETDHEITAKLIRNKIPIKEVPIDYEPRSREEGKKIGAKDGIKAVWTLLKFRFFN